MVIKRGVFLFFFVAALSWSGNIGSVESVTGVDVSQSVSESQWKCLQSPGGQGPVEFAIVRVYRSSGTLDPNGASSIIAAKAAGIKYVDGYIFPCVTCGDPLRDKCAILNQGWRMRVLNMGCFGMILKGMLGVATKYRIKILLRK